MWLQLDGISEPESRPERLTKQLGKGLLETVLSGQPGTAKFSAVMQGFAALEMKGFLGKRRTQPKLILGINGR